MDEEAETKAIQTCCDRLSTRMSPQRPLAWIVLAFLICLSAGVQPAGAYFVQFDWPPVPEVGVPTDPFARNAFDMRVLRERWRTIEANKDNMDFPAYERLRLNVERAQEGIETLERHARDHVRLCRQFESELSILYDQINEFRRQLEAHSGRTYADREEFEQAAAPFRSKWAVLRPRVVDMAARAENLNRKLQNELKPERERAERLVVLVIGELAEVRQGLPIGAAGAVSGSVIAIHTWGGGDPVRLSSGMVVYYGDEIRTGPAGRMQVLLLDETIFTVGPDTELTLDDFVYDPFTHMGKITATLAKGAIRFVSGNIAAKQPENMKIKLPVGTLGIRGTEFIIEVGEDGRSRVDVLEGMVEYTSGRDGSSVLIREGERLLVSADGAIGRPTEIDIEQVERTWAVGTGSESEPETVAPPFRLKHYVIGLVALVLVAVALWNMSGWHILPMAVLAYLFLACLEATRFSTDGWWWLWWMVCALAGYVLFCLLALLACDIAKELTKLLHRIWPVMIGLGVIATMAGLVSMYEGMDILVRYMYQFVHQRSIFASPSVYRQLSPGGEIMMFTGWALTGLGLLVAIGGVATVMGSLGERSREDDDSGQTPLHVAASSGRLKVVQRLLAKGAYANEKDKNGSTPLHLAARWDHEEVAGLLLANGANVNAKTNTGGTPLHEAASMGQEEVARLLLANGAKVNPKDNDGRTPLHEAALTSHEEVAGLLLANGANVNAKTSIGGTPLHVAASMGREQVARLLLANGANVNAKTTTGGTPLHEAALTSHEEVARLLLAHGANVNAKTTTVGTPLHEAALMGWEQMARLLLAHGAATYAKNDGGKTPQDVAIYMGQKEVARLLVPSGADVKAANDDDATSLYEAGMEPTEQDPCLVCGVEFGEERVSTCPGCDFFVHRTCLSTDMVPGGRLCRMCSREAAAGLQAGLHLANGAKVSAKTNTGGRTPLHEAAFMGRPKVAQRLLAKGADANARDNDGSTPLHLAAEEAVAGLLLANGANVNAKTYAGRTPLHEAAWYGRDEVAQRLLAKGADANARDNDGSTPLHLATEEEEAGLLLANGANVNAKTNTGWTPLHVAASMDWEQVARLLLANGANVSAKTNTGSTPLHEAAYMGKEEVARLLLAHGAATYAKNDEGKTPQDVAIDMGQKEVARLLVPSGADVKAANDDGATSLYEAGVEPPEQEPTCLVCGDVFAGSRRSQCPNCRQFVHRVCLSQETVPGGRLCGNCSRERTDSDEWTEPGHDRDSVPPAAPGRPCGDTMCDGCDRHFNILPVAEAQDVKYVDMLEGMAIPFWCPNCGDLICTDCMACEQGVELDGPVMLSKTCSKCNGSRELLPTDELAELQEEVERDDPEADNAVGLTEQQRVAEISTAVRQLTKLGGAAALQYALGNGKAYEHIRPQIVKVGERLERLGGISLVDSVYYRLEEVADRAAVREVTLAWKSGLSGWTM